MTQHLEALKKVLDKALNNPHFGIEYYASFIEAAQDAIYSCQLGTETALTQWLESWKATDQDVCGTDKQYQQGVKFVQAEWNKLKGEEL
jgi:hypothetical protein